MTRRWIGILTLVGAAAVGCGRSGKVPVGVAPNQLADSADQVMFHIQTVLTDKGLLRAGLEADTAYFFDDNARVEMRNVRTTFYSSTGQKTSVLTSRQGTYDTRRSETEARKNVVVVSEDGRRLETAQLKYQQGANQISSDSAFVLTEPTRTVRGIGFTSDPDMKNVRVFKTFVLPGQ
jgi:LPS export ABC transporter protein LptC